MGDFNIDLLKASSNSAILAFYDIICSSYFIPHILHPSRVTHHSQTLIDNIFSNTLDYQTTSGNFEHQISDHLVQFLLLHNFFHSDRSKFNIIERDFRFFNPDEFKNDLSNVNWDAILSYNETDACFNSFYNTLNYLLDEHAPLRTLTKKEKSLKLKPWINNEIKKQMSLRDKLFRKFRNARDNDSKKVKYNEYKINY